MNLDKLKVGMEVKNYKVLCELIGEDVKAGDSKKYQVRNWERYFSYSKKGQKFKINEIYDTEKDKIDNRSNGNNCIYSKHIQKLILDMLAQEENDGEIFLSTNQILRKLEMINDNYALGKRNIPKLSELLKVDKNVVADFYEYTHIKLKTALESALRSLENKSMIYWTTDIQICVSKVDVEVNILGEPKIENGKPCYKINNIHRPATKAEIQLILKVEKDKLKSMGLETKQDVKIRNKMKQFFKEVNNELKEIANIDYYYKCYRIITNKESLLKRLSRSEKTETFNTLNGIVMDQVNKTIDVKHDNVYEKFKDVKEIIPLIDMKSDTQHIINKTDVVRLSDTYVKEAKKISKTVIDRKYRNLKFI